MKLGKPKRYTLFRNDNSSSSASGVPSNSVIIPIMANHPNNHQNPLVTSMSSWLLVPKGRNFRHILATVLCVILVYHVTLLAIPTNNLPSSPSSNGAVGENNEINTMPSAIPLTLCESCEENELGAVDATPSNQISQPQNSFNKDNTQDIPIVGTSAKSGSQVVVIDDYEDASSSQSTSSHQLNQARSSNGGGKSAANISPPETPASNYNYYYTDEMSNGKRNENDNSSNDNQFEEESEATSSLGESKTGSVYSQSQSKDNNNNYNHNNGDDDNGQPHDVVGMMSKTIISKKDDAKKTVRRQSDKHVVSKKVVNVQYQKRKKLLDSIFLSIKSTKRFHKTRLEPVINTWFNLARDQTWIFTDDDDPELNRRKNVHIINTHCPATHYRQALCCKMSAEFDTFMKSQKSWFCHFDDDSYVNVPALLDLLSKYDHKEDWYLGKPSLKSPIKIPHPDNKSEEISFWFVTGGAGFCLSRALAKRMSPVASGGKFTDLCDSIQLHDDVTMGYIAGHLLGRNLTVIPQFHSHFETMRFMDMKNPHPEITFSYVRYADDSLNTLEIDGFSEEEDPTRFRSLHCLLFPNFSFCPKSKR